MESIDALPAWAQLEIQSLRAQVEALKKQIPVDAESNTTYGVELLEGKRDLPHECRVQFHEDRKNRRYIEAHMRTEDSHLYLVSLGPIVVVPRAANAVRVRLG